MLLTVAAGLLCCWPQKVAVQSLSKTLFRSQAEKADELTQGLWGEGEEWPWQWQQSGGQPDHTKPDMTTMMT